MDRVTASKARFLIWGLSFGRRCRGLAPLWLNSISQIGRWRHDVVILGDKLVLSLSAPNLKVINIVPDVETKYSFPHRQWDAYVCHNWKPQIQFYTDLSQYDYALYLDMDVLVNTDRLEALLASKVARNKICVQKDVIPISADRFFTGRDTLTAEEKAKWGEHSMCAGIIGFPTTEVGLRFARHWFETNQEGKFRKNDQSNLIALLLRHYPNDWEYLGDTVIARRLGRYEETLLHFSAGRHALMRDYYGKTLHLKEPDARKQKLFRFTRELLWRPVNRIARSWGKELWKFRAVKQIGRILWRFRTVRRFGHFIWQ
jgi:hypothetical protein